MHKHFTVRTVRCVRVWGWRYGVADAWYYGMAKADFLLREGGFLVGATENSLPHDRETALLRLEIRVALCRCFVPCA